MSERWFKVLFFSNKNIQSMLDAIVFLSNPSEKESAHITFAGPYYSDESTKLESRILEYTDISILGAGNFFSNNQNTVFLKCDSPLLKRVWHKPDFPYNPHITLYDGKNRNLAEKLFNIVNSHRLFFSTPVGPPVSVHSIKGQKGFGLWFGLNSDVMRDSIGVDIRPPEMASQNIGVRLGMIDRICTRLKWEAMKKSRRKR
ncbi:MAG: hypothetical protein SVR94_17150 [Pseudomonadota bacterium]|nr:hypothetical protein [Pseudomonadota bacterium]